MANSSSAFSSAAALLSQPVTEKLNKANHALWRAQVMATLRGAQLDGYVTGKLKAPAQFLVPSDDDKAKHKEPEPNPEYAQWLAAEQQVLAYLLNSLGRDVMAQVASLTTVADVWKEIEGTFSSQSRARVINTRMALASTVKGSLTISEYYGKMRALTEEMASAGKRLDDKELASYILAGLDSDYNPVVSSIATRVEPISLSEVYSQMLSFEMRLDMQQGGPQVNAAMRGGGLGQPRDGNRGRVQSRGERDMRSDVRGRGGGDQRQSGGKRSDVICQLCEKRGHHVTKCWKRFDRDFKGSERTAAAAVSFYGVDTNWLCDSGATDHITSELEKMSVRDKYSGGDQVHTASGTGSSHEEGASARPM